MSGRWVDVTDSEGFKRPSWLSPGLIVAIAFALLIIVVIVDVLISRGGDGDVPQNDLSIAQLRGDPEGYDGVEVELIGTVSNRYTIPFLDQYGIYEFNDGSSSMFVLSDKGAPPDDQGEVRISAVFNGAVELDDQIRNLIEDQLGSAAGFLADQLLPGIPLNVAFLTHQQWEAVDDVSPPENRYELPVVGSGLQAYGWG